MAVHPLPAVIAFGVVRWGGSHPLPGEGTMKAIGSLEGKYEILDKLHEGGMGAIYRVRHHLLDEIRVIKVMRPEHEANEALRARFLREAQLAVRLRHPHIAQMYDFAFDDAGRAFIVMEYVEGISLQQMLGRVGAPPLRLSLDLSRQALTALGFLHRKGIVHRDISPDNIMVAWDDFGRPMVKLIDLGIAKVATRTTGLTASGTFLGKVLYASPEQFGASGSNADQRSDIYSLGVVIYELFTGNRPFPGTSPEELIAGHLVKPPLDFAISDPDGRVPGDLREIVLKAMAKRPEERYASAEALDEALAAVQTRFPPDPDDYIRILQAYDSQPTAKTRGAARGSTERRINAQFGLASTPQPISLTDAQDQHPCAPTPPFPASGAARTGTMQTGEAGPVATPPDATQPTPILPADACKPPFEAAGAEARDGAPVAAALAAAGVEPVPTPGPVANKKAVRLLLAAGGAATVLAVALMASRGILQKWTQRAAAAPPTRAVPAPRVPHSAEPLAPVAPKGGVSPAGLEEAIAVGSVERLRAMVSGLSDIERAEMEATREGAHRLDVARRSVEADTALEKAVAARNWATAVQQASALVALLPASREAQQARETAAAALEARADTLVRQGRPGAALARLRTLQEAWPDRTGLEARIANVHTAREADQRFASALAEAATAETERRPEKGLEALARVVPESHWDGRFAAVRQRLESLLARLDTAPPVIRLRAGSKLDYSKGKAATLPFVVTDDYRVKSVTVLARREGASAYQELPARSTGNDQYAVEITPEFHGNKTVEIYVVATDYAGHSSRLGSAEQPLHVKKRWLF